MKKLFFLLVIVALIAACTPAVSTTRDTAPPEISQPNTPDSGQPTLPPTLRDTPKIEEEPLPMILSERDHHPYNWLPGDVKGLDAWGDSISDAKDITAIYQRQMDGNFEFRLDILNFEDNKLPPIYFAIDFLEGGNNLINQSSTITSEIEWDLLVSVVAGEFKLLDATLTVLPDQLVSTEVNRQLDFVYFAISEGAFAGWDRNPFQIQVLMLNDALTAVIDETTPVTTDSIIGRAKLVLPFEAVFNAPTPHFAVRYYDGVFTVPDEWVEDADVRYGTRRGYRYLLDAVERYELPLTITTLQITELPGGEYTRLHERYRHLASRGLFDPLTTLSYGHFMPMQPNDVDTKAIEIAIELREGLGIAVSDVFYPYEGMLSPGDIELIKESGFESIYALNQASYSFFDWETDWTNIEGINENITISRKMHQFNGLKFFFNTQAVSLGFVVDERWGDTDWMIDWTEYQQYYGTDEGLHLFLRRVLHDLAMDSDQEQFYAIGADLDFTAWGFADAVEWNFQWLASHPWIEVTTFSSIAERGWKAIDHGEIEADLDEVLMRYPHLGDGHYNAYFRYHYYGGVSDGHSPIVPAGVEIESYYDYMPYLKVGEFPLSRRIMGDDKTPGSVVYETVSKLREAPDNPITTLAWLSYFMHIGEQAFHDGASLVDLAKNQANLLSQVNKIVAAAHWVDETAQGTLASETQVYERDLDLDDELEYVMHNDQVFAIFENDGGRLEFAFAYDPVYGPVQLIAPASQYFFMPDPSMGFDIQNGEATIPLGWPGTPDGAFVEDIDHDGNFEYVPLPGLIEGQSLTFSYETHPVTKTFTLEGDRMQVHYERGGSETLTLGFASAVNQLGVFERDWIWNFEKLEMEEVQGWQMTSGGAVLLNVDESYSVETASFYDSPARADMHQREGDGTYPEGHWMCFPCSWIKVLDTDQVDFSLTLSAAPIDKGAYTPLPPPKPTPVPPTPGPTPSIGQIEGGYVVYGDGLTEGWTLDPWGGTADLFTSVSVYQGSSAIEITLVPDGGAITFDNSSFDTSLYDYMVFYLNGSITADQEIYIEMISNDNNTLGRVELADFIEDYPLQPDTWHRVLIPLITLNPSLQNFGWFDVGDASGSGASIFYIDEINFVGSEP